MAFYEVYVGAKSYQGKEALTYSGPGDVSPGSLVHVPLRSLKAIGIVFRKTTKPKFTTKELELISPPLILPTQTFAFLKWLADYYAAPLGAIAGLFLPPALPLKFKLEDVPTSKTQPIDLPPLTPEQQAVLKKLQGGSDSALLHGETGTGKTRVYLELARRQLAIGKHSLILTPEIGLTGQLAKVFETQFPGQVITYHSNLTPAARRKAWLRVLSSDKPAVVIGTRSALFLPFAKLGFIAIDEAHEPAYKQEQQPRYSALRAASFLARQHGARLLYGSATPLISEYYLAKQKKAPILAMSRLATGKSQSFKLTVVPINDRTHFSQDPYLSDELLAELRQTISEKSQALIFLNRRGTARAIICQSCGWRSVCPHCSLPLTYHGDAHELRCHTCGYHEQVPVSCPICQSADIVFKSLGTKALAELLANHFPGARIQRFDTDNLTDERLEKHIQQIKKGNVDIIVGTQILAKGLDLPYLRLVAVVQADISLQLPDFSSEERTYQLLQQVVGRVGRGHRDSVVVVQTHNPDNPAIHAALAKDYQGFYQTELEHRQQFVFPPFCYLLALKVSRASRQSAQQAAKQLRNTLAKNSAGLDVIGPAPAFHEQMGGKYHWQLVIKAKDRQRLQEIALSLPSGWTFDLDPVTLL